MHGGSLITRTGNKTLDIKHFIDLLPMDVKNVIEPFGGAFAVIRDVYPDRKYKKFVNDIDPSLYYIYTHPYEFVEGLKKWNIINDKNISNTDKKKQFKNLNFNKYISHGVLSAMASYGHSKNKKLDNADADIQLMKNINFSNDDAFIIIDKFKKKSNSFLFLDPPYICTDNTQYGLKNNVEQNNNDIEIYNRIYDILDDTNNKSKIMLIIYANKNANKIFKKFIVRSYYKINQINKERKKYFIILNY